MNQEKFASSYGVLLEKVYGPAFFTKLATKYNIVPTNDEDKLKLLEMAAMLRSLELQEQEKVASGINPSSQFIDSGLSLLHQATKVVDPSIAAIGDEHSHLIREAASAMIQDEEIKKAAAEYLESLNE